MLTVLLGHEVDSESRIKRHFNDSNCPYVSGLEIYGTSIYSICPGKVVAVGKDCDNTYCVSVLVNNRQMIRYAHLSYSDVYVGQYIDISDYVGRCDKFMRLEYCTSDTANELWPVRVKGLLMYKHNPEGLLDGTLKLSVYYDRNLTSGEYIPDSASDELSNNRGN